MELAPQLIRPHIRGYESPIYAVMHLFGLSNACVNPILYGYLNENFRKEYRSIYRCVDKKKMLAFLAYSPTIRRVGTP